MEPFETFEYTGCTIELYQDEDPMSPAEWDTLGKLCGFQRHYTFQDDVHGEAVSAMARGGVALLIRYLRMVHDVYALPYDIYDHGQSTIKECALTNDNCSGYIYADARSIEMTGVALADVEEGLRAELQTWANYFEGAVVGYVVKCEGEAVGSCWGFYPDEPKADDPFGLDYVRAEAKADAENEQALRQQAAEQGIPTVPGS